MKKRLLYIMILLAGITGNTFVYGQNNSMLDKLVEKTWQAKPLDGGPYYTISRYNYNTKTSSLYVEDKPCPPQEASFYLSDQHDTQFDNSKVGKIQNGKYLIVKGNGITRNLTAYEILKLDDTNLDLKLLLEDGTDILYFKSLGYSMQYIISNAMSTEKLPFDGTKQAGFITSHGTPISNLALTESNTYPIENNYKIIPEKLYSNVQLTASLAVPQKGKFFRKFKLSNDNYIVVVSFGGAGATLVTAAGRTDILCLVDKNGNILSTLEGMVAGKGMTVKQYRITENGTIHISRVVPSSSTSLRFEDVTSFTGIVETVSYSIANNKFTGMAGSGTATKTFTKELLSDQSKNVWQY